MLKVIVTFGREAYKYRRFRAQGETAVQARIGVTVRQTLFSLVVNTTTAAGSALVIGVGAWHVLKGDLTVGELLVVLGYIAAIYKPLEQLSGTVSSLQEQFVGLASVFSSWTWSPRSVIPGARRRGTSFRPVAFENVSFAYPNRNRHAREVIASRSSQDRGWRSSGRPAQERPRSSGFWRASTTPMRGGSCSTEWTCGSSDWRSLRDQMSIVMQEPLLFTGTIAENIRYGRLEAIAQRDRRGRQAGQRRTSSSAACREVRDGPRRARRAAVRRRASAHLRSRAPFSDAPILILDEPTSSIDSRTESVILDALDRLTNGRTTFMIAHRLSTIHSSDRILVMDRGRVDRSRHPRRTAPEGRSLPPVVGCPNRWARERARKLVVEPAARRRHRIERTRRSRAAARVGRAGRPCHACGE